MFPVSQNHDAAHDCNFIMYAEKNGSVPKIEVCDLDLGIIAFRKVGCILQWEQHGQLFCQSTHIPDNIPG